MKIQTKNSQCNISHKAYFTNNTNLKKIVQESAHNSYLSNNSYNILRKLPDHELTISNLVKNGGEYIAEIINKQTGLKSTCQFEAETNPLMSMLECIKEKHMKIFNRYYADYEYANTIQNITRDKNW